VCHTFIGRFLKFCFRCECVAYFEVLRCHWPTRSSVTNRGVSSFPVVMEPENSSPSTKKHAIELDSKLVQSNSHKPYFPGFVLSMPRYSQCFLSTKFTKQNITDLCTSCPLKLCYTFRAYQPACWEHVRNIIYNMWSHL
jgi:hypothetical protein